MSDPVSPTAPVSNSQTLAPLVRGGWRSTEFWLTVALIIALGCSAAAGLVPPDHAAILAAISAWIYKALRTYLKVQATGFTPAAFLEELANIVPKATPDQNGQARGAAEAIKHADDYFPQGAGLP